MSRKSVARWLFTVAWATVAAGTAAAQDTVPLIPRDALFGNPERTQARLSPDGRYLSWLAPRDGVMNVYVAPIDDPSRARPVTNDRKSGIRVHQWAYSGRHVLYLQDDGGDENFHVHSVDVTTEVDTDLTPLKGIAARLVAVSWRKPYSVLVALNDREPEWHDLYEIDLRTAQRRLIEQNTQRFADYIGDLDLVPRLAQKATATGNELWRRTPRGWIKLLEYGPEDSLTTGPLAIEAGGRHALLLSSIGRDTSALTRLDLVSGAQTVLAANDRADIESVWLDPRTHRAQAYGVNYLRTTYHALQPRYARDIERLTAALGSIFTVTSRTLDDRRWIVVADEPTRPATTHLYDRRSGAIVKLFDQRPALHDRPLVPMQALELKARDGLMLVSYLSLPPLADRDGDGRPEQPVPLVLNVHGGPWSRDVYGFDPQHQWLANRGYAVLSVNFRGSGGFGKNFLNAGDREWAGKMHDDLIDAVNWAIAQKIAPADKIAIYGGSYGGYATLVGLTFTPETFACGVDIVGPSNLNTLLATIPPYWQSFFEEFARRVGDPRTEEGRKLLTERSPLTRVDAIRRPLLIAQGANDPRVKKAESDQIVAAMQARGLPVTYVLYPDEGHDFARPENRRSFYAISEAFLAQCLGGRYEPIGSDFDGASLEVPAGAEHVPGLSAALAARPRRP
ncbi:MAG: S9 family peptidase [Steroidobacteraceae bacterium]|nr:S9 family peptidase [Steroidobacteraceae bacterium]MDW8259125.1 S9 family peptidase [Gammaproteobacteria bacterium]